MSEPLTAEEALIGALRDTYTTEFPEATEDDWKADADFMLARLQEYGSTLDAAREGLGLDERCPVIAEPTPHRYEISCSACGQPGQVRVSIVERPAAAQQREGAGE